ncbi:MAG: hypothetical protein R3F31_16070 [Verrucomicrobiales bacterium]
MFIFPAGLLLVIWRRWWLAFSGRDRFEVLGLEIGIPMAPVSTVKGERRRDAVRILRKLYYYNGFRFKPAAEASLLLLPLHHCAMEEATDSIGRP